MRKVLMFLSVALLLGLEAVAHAQFTIHVIDVGQADAILLEFKSAAILIDAGGEVAGDDRYKEHFLSDLNTFFANRQDLHRTLQAIIVTHPHIDHTRLLMDVFENFTVKYFYDGGDMKGSGAPQLKQARDFASTHAIKYSAIRDDAIGKKGSTPDGLKKLASGVDVRFLAGSRDCANANNNSLVVRVHYGDKTVLLTGDSETDDDDECVEGQVEHLLERYQGTDLLRADVYKVGHHGSHNGTDQALVSAVSPAIAIISAGNKETKGPGVFHGFFFGHPREDVVELLEATAENRTPPISAYTYLKGTKDKEATGTIIEGREIAKAIYCTCWDGDVTVSMNGESDQLAVAIGNHPIDGAARRETVNFVGLSPHPRVSPFAFANLAPSDRTHLSDRERIMLAVLLVLIPIFIYIFMRAHESRRADRRKEAAAFLIMRARGAQGWKFTRFELGAFVRRFELGAFIPRGQEGEQYSVALQSRYSSRVLRGLDNVRKHILRLFWPRPRIGINEVVEQAVAELLRAGEYDSPHVNMSADERQALIKAFEHLHSDPDNLPDLLGPPPSTMFLVAALPVIVLFIAIQAVPQVGNYLAGIFGQNSLLEELWAGLLASIVGTGATLLREKSVESRQRKKSPKKSQSPQPPKEQEQQSTTEDTH